MSILNKLFKTFISYGTDIFPWYSTVCIDKANIKYIRYTFINYNKVNWNLIVLTLQILFYSH